MFKYKGRIFDFWVKRMGNCNFQAGRYAPSPSGIMHMGNLSSCLLAWLDARSVGGKLIFRMEDLDPERSSDGFAENIAAALSVLGLDWDIGYPDEKYRQSRRRALYEDVFDRLLKKDMVYPCYCTRSRRLGSGSVCNCRSLSRLQRAELEASGRAPAWKIRVPDKVISFTDLHYGHFSENLADSGDFIIKRSDGHFAYQLAVSFDDMDMGITRVVRGRDILPSTARQIWLITELGGAVPDYCHAPLITTPQKRKLSKRFGDLGTDALLTRYSPDELIGHIAGLLGIHDGKSVTAKELLESFDWKNVRMDDIIIA